MYQNLIYSIADGIATITINRPAVRNALNIATLDELPAAFDSVREDGSVRVVIVTGSGEKAFVAGADISEIAPLAELDPADSTRGEAFAHHGQSVFNVIESLGKP